MTAAIRPPAQARWTLDENLGLGTLIAPYDWNAGDRRAVYLQLETMGWSVLDVDHLFRTSPDNPVVVRLLSRITTTRPIADVA